MTLHCATFESTQQFLSTEGYGVISLFNCEQNADKCDEIFQ